MAARLMLFALHEEGIGFGCPPNELMKPSGKKAGGRPNPHRFTSFDEDRRNDTLSRDEQNIGYRA
jgi:hypothetical protein